MTKEQKTKILASTCYIPPLFAVLLFAKRKEQLVYFHAKQALGTWIFFGLAYLCALLPGQFFAIGKWPLSISLGALFSFHLVMGVLRASRGEAKALSPVGEFIDTLPIFSKLQAR